MIKLILVLLALGIALVAFRATARAVMAIGLYLDERLTNGAAWAGGHPRHWALLCTVLVVVAAGATGWRWYSVRRADAEERAFYERAARAVEAEVRARAAHPQRSPSARLETSVPAVSPAHQEHLDDLLAKLPASTACPDSMVRFSRAEARSALAPRERLRAYLAAIPDEVACATDLPDAQERLGAAEDAAMLYGQAASLELLSGERAEAHRHYGLSVRLFRAALHESPTTTDPAGAATKAMLRASEAGYVATR